MRKYLSLLIILLIAPIVVLADSSGPSILGYEAVIINKNGIKVVDYEDKTKTIAYNTKVYVTDENKDEGMVTICTNWKDGACEDGSYQTEASNVAAIKKEVTPSDLNKKTNYETSLVKSKKKYIILAKEGVKLSKGPADIYDKYDKVVPYLQVVESTYYISPGMDSISWVYVDSNGYKGWLEPSKNEVGEAVGELLTFGSSDLLDADGNVIDSINSETVINTAYYLGERYYIEYNGKYGFVKTSDKNNLGYKEEEGYVLTIKKTDMTSGDGSVIKTIPIGERVKILYAARLEYQGDVEYHYPYPVLDVYYVEYDGSKGFVSEKTVARLAYEYKVTKMAVKEDTKLYDVSLISDYPKDEEKIEDFVNRFNVIETIPSGGTISTYAVDYFAESVEPRRQIVVYLVKYRDNVGCIVEEVKDDDNGEDVEPTATPSTTDEPVISPTTTPEEKTDNPGVATKTEKNDNLIIICVIVSVVVSVIAIVSAVLINKKSKKELEKKLAEAKKEPVEEKKEEAPVEKTTESNKTKKEE